MQHCHFNVLYSILANWHTLRILFLSCCFSRLAAVGDGWGPASMYMQASNLVSACRLRHRRKRSAILQPARQLRQRKKVTAIEHGLMG